MAISQELDDRIEKQMADFTPDRYLRAGMAYNRFVKELTNLTSFRPGSEQIMIKPTLTDLFNAQTCP